MHKETSSLHVIQLKFLLYLAMPPLQEVEEDESFLQVNTINTNWQPFGGREAVNAKKIWKRRSPMWPWWWWWWCGDIGDFWWRWIFDMSIFLSHFSCELASKYKTQKFRGADRNRGWGVYVAKQYLLVGYLYSICSVFVQAAWSSFCLYRGVGRGPKPWTLRQAVVRLRLSFLYWKKKKPYQSFF